MDIRSKARTLPRPVNDPAKFPRWNYDGSNAGQAPAEGSEVILYPQAIFKDPFRKGNNILVLCDTYTQSGDPLPTNERFNAAKIFSHPEVAAEEPWYKIRQQFTLLEKDTHWPLGWDPEPQRPHYCGTGTDKADWRDIVDSHYKACLYAGINIRGINGQAMPGLDAPAVGISAGDELWVARYILERITETAGVVVSFDPKPIQGDWNGAAAPTYYSTKSMRNNGGFEVIEKAIEKLKLKHNEHIAAYGECSETGVANQEALVRVGRDAAGKGYLEDRRPASNMDPYVVTSMIAETTILWKP